jgi:acetyl-CoA carboxylase beta subunit
VVLTEAARELGGRVAAESRLPGLHAWRRVSEYREQQLRRMRNVEIYLQSPMTAGDVLEAGFGHVVTATGARWRRDGAGRWHTRPIPVDGSPQVLTPDDLMAGVRPAGKRVLLYDDDHYYLGGVLAELLAGEGYRVELVTPAAHVSAWTVNTLELVKIRQRVMALGVTVRANRAVARLTGTGAVTACVFTGEQEEVTADAVVLVTARLPASGLPPSGGAASGLPPSGGAASGLPPSGGAGAGIELHPRWAPNVVTILGQLAGRTVGVIANNPIRLGGCLDATSAEKAARFVRMCDAFGVPLVVIVDVPGYLPGVGQEWDGVVRRGAKLLHAFAEAKVPRITLVTRKAYGGAYIAMNSRALGATSVFAWPTAEIAVMGPVAAVRILHRRTLAEVPPEKLHEVESDLAAEHQRAAGGLQRACDIGVVDEIIEPTRTREAVARAIAEAPSSRGSHGNIPL